jgi:hypothetical protein
MIPPKVIEEFEKFSSTGIHPEELNRRIKNFLERSHNIPIEQAIKKYREYIDWWTSRYFDTEERYIPGKDKAVHFEKFIGAYMYRNIYKHKQNKTEQYLFGNMDIQKIEVFIKDFEIKNSL